jgi:hypothetical protein
VIGNVLTPLRLALWIGKLAPSNEDYPLLPYLRVLLKNSKDLVYHVKRRMKFEQPPPHGSTAAFCGTRDSSVVAKI